MKTKVLYLVILLLAAGSLMNRITGQEKTLTQKEKEEKLQQAIELQKKVMQEKSKAVEQMAGDIQVTVSDLRKEGEGGAGQSDPARRNRPSGYTGRDAFDGSVFFMPGNVPGNFGFHRGGDSERTSFDFARSLKESTITQQIPFSVDNNASNVVMNIMGDCKSGEIKINIIMPGGKTYSEVIIDESGNLNWRKSFTITGEENRDKTGEWIFRIETTKATGYFRIFIQTY